MTVVQTTQARFVEHCSRAALSISESTATTRSAKGDGQKTHVVSSEPSTPTTRPRTTAVRSAPRGSRSVSMSRLLSVSEESFDHSSTPSFDLRAEREAREHEHERAQRERCREGAELPSSERAGRLPERIMDPVSSAWGDPEVDDSLGALREHHAGMADEALVRRGVHDP